MAHIVNTWRRDFIFYDQMSRNPFFRTAERWPWDILTSAAFLLAENEA